MATKLYRSDKTLEFAVEANNQDEAKRVIKKLIDEVNRGLPTGVRFTTAERTADGVRAYSV